MQRAGLVVSVALVLGLGAIAVSLMPAHTTAWATERPASHSTLRPRGTVHYVLASHGNSARYFVREQLAGINFPSDAVGVTDGVTGGIVLDDNGHIVPAESKFVVDITRLKSDRDMRDGYIQRHTLQTDQYPTVTLVPRELKGLPTPLPASGRATFTLLGDLTVHGVTRPTTWNVTAVFRGSEIRGTASTGFTFDDFHLDKPKVGAVLSVADSIYLVYDFNLVPAPSAGPAPGS